MQSSMPNQVLGNEITPAKLNQIGALHVHSDTDLLIPNSRGWDNGTTYTSLVGGAELYGVSKFPRSGWCDTNTMTLYEAAQLTREKIEMLFKNYPMLKQKYEDKLRYEIRVSGYRGVDPVYTLKRGKPGVGPANLENVEGVELCLTDVPNAEYLDTRFSSVRNLQLSVLSDLQLVFELLEHAHGTCGSIWAPELLVWRTPLGKLGYVDHVLPNYRCLYCDIRVITAADNTAFLCICPLRSAHAIKIGVVYDSVVKQLAGLSSVLVNDVKHIGGGLVRVKIDGVGHVVTTAGFMQPIWWHKLRDKNDID